MDIDRVFLLLFAAWGILATCFAIWQSKYTRCPQHRCPDCGAPMQAEWYCFYCDDLTARML